MITKTDILTQSSCCKYECDILLQNIKYLRLQYKLTKRAMSSILEISVFSLNKIENGILPPKLGVAICFNIEDYFGISPALQLSERLEQS